MGYGPGRGDRPGTELNYPGDGRLTDGSLGRAPEDLIVGLILGLAAMRVTFAQAAAW
jgi:hypothetical protein